MMAAKEALEDAGLPMQGTRNTPQQQPLRIGFISATSVGGMDLSEHFYEAFKQDPSRDNCGK